MSSPISAPVALSCLFLDCSSPPSVFFFFFNDTATTEIYTLSLHDALPISSKGRSSRSSRPPARATCPWSSSARRRAAPSRSEEHTSELQSHSDLVCRLLLEKKKNNRRGLVDRTNRTRT